MGLNRLNKAACAPRPKMIQSACSALSSAACTQAQNFFCPVGPLYNCYYTRKTGECQFEV